MKRIKVLLDFLKISIAEKIVFYKNVIAKLTGNQMIPITEETLAEGKSVVDNLEASSIAAKDGSHTAISKMHDCEKAADEFFRPLAMDVELKSGGDETKILSSGFHASGQPVKPQKAALTVYNDANSGCVKLIAKAVPKAGSYIWQHCKGALPADEKGWISAGYTTQASNELDGLDVAEVYYFRFAAITPEGTTDFCAPVMKVIV